MTTQYLIKSGDTLSAIAKKQGTTIDALMKANPNITDPNKIYAGASLNLPTTGGLTVTTGTTLTGQIGTWIDSKTGLGYSGPQKSPLDKAAPTGTGGTSVTPPKTITDESKDISSSIINLEGQVSDFQKQKDALTKYGLTDANQLTKDASGNWVPKSTTDETGGGTLDDAVTQLINFYKKQSEDFLTLQNQDAAILAQEHQDTVNKITADTNYSIDTVTQAYTTAQRDIEKAFLLIPGLSALPKEQVTDLADKLSDLNKNFTTNITKINADEAYAISTGDTTYQSSLNQQKKDYMTFVTNTMNSMIDFQYKQQNLARENVNTLVSSGGISKLSDSELTNVAKNSGYSLEQLQSMKKSVGENIDKYTNFINKTDEAGNVTIIGITKTGKAEVIGTFEGAATPTGLYAPVTSGSLSISKTDIAIGQNKLEDSRGNDNYADTQLYLDMIDHWTSNGGMLDDFLKQYSPKTYINPNDPLVPDWLKNYLKTSSYIIQIGATQ